MFTTTVGESALSTSRAVRLGSEGPEGSDCFAADEDGAGVGDPEGRDDVAAEGAVVAGEDAPG
ncbi:hypothetical protein ACSBQY_05510, partial [Micrococcus lylae]|uniref:hypothetical protein n=1 Tax=Micrococcus lylae TaxID=1273 RepID=UPI003EC03882